MAPARRRQRGGSSAVGSGANNGGNNDADDESADIAWRASLDFSDWIDARRKDPISQKMVWARAQIVEVGADFSDMKIQFENTLSDVWTTRFSEDIARDGKHSGSTSTALSLYGPQRSASSGGGNSLTSHSAVYPLSNFYGGGGGLNAIEDVDDDVNASSDPTDFVAEALEREPWRRRLKVGALLDGQDGFGKWYNATVVATRHSWNPNGGGSGAKKSEDDSTDLEGGGTGSTGGTDGEESDEDEDEDEDDEDGTIRRRTNTAMR